MLASVSHAAGKAVEDSILPSLAILMPLLGGIAVIVAGRRERLRNALAVAFAAAAFAVCAAMFPSVMSRGTTLVQQLPLLFAHSQFSMFFKVDSLGLVFALVATALWLAATVYSYNYIQHEERRTRYYAFAMFTESATIGVFLAGNFFVLFVFFELMGFLAYMLVIHNQTYDARRAGVKYIFMTIYGGLSLLLGILLYYSYSGGVVGFGPLPGSAYLTGAICFVAVAFMMGGFGVKAGMVPLHVWLPLAHPAAPSPASALLSGVMIKAGIFGFLRIIETMQTPAATVAGTAELAGRGAALSTHAEHVSKSMQNLHTLGWVLMLLAAVTMVTGMVLALVQDNVKRLLAYSSISQIGYIMLGLGAGAYLGAEGSMGLAGGIYHVMNHALFKGLLFLGVGAVYYATHELNMTHLGGLWRRMPFTTVFCCIAALGIMGIPLFNGFASKTLLHHAVVETLPFGGAWARTFDIVFMLTAGGTACYVAKLIILTFFGHQRSEEHHEVKEVPSWMKVGMGALAAGVLFFGLFPGLIMNRFIVPALRVFTGLEPAGVHHMEEMHFFTWSNIAAILPSLAIGALVLVVMMKWDLFRLRLPKTAGIDYYYSRVEVGFLRTCFSGSKRYGELKAEYIPMAKTTGEYVYDWYKGLKPTMKRWSRKVSETATLWSMNVQGFTMYVRAKQFSGDIAFGITLIALLLGLAAFLLL